MRRVAKRALNLPGRHSPVQARIQASLSTKPIPPPHTSRDGGGTGVTDMTAYHSMYKESIEDPHKFWSHQAKSLLHWQREPEQSVAGSMRAGNLRWFADGRLNACENCVDRHAEATPDKVALIWEADEPEQHEHVTYAELLDMVCKTANVLKTAGVRSGDTVVLYMPMVPQAVVTMLACARIGAMHSVVFAGFSAHALHQRIKGCGARVVVTADQALRGGRVIELKRIVNEALDYGDHAVDTVFVHQRTHANVPMRKGRDRVLAEAMQRERPWCPAEPFSAEHPLFVLYTSGSTGQPKGLVHTTGGYLVYAALSHRSVFDLRPDDVYACVADVGWITGHTYITYGPLLNGATTVLFESLPTYPDASRYWRMVDQHKISIFYTAPTAIRALMREGDDPVKPHKLDSLRVLGTVGEPINPAAWQWYYDVVGRGKCSIVDTYWQTEGGGFYLTGLGGVTPMKPGAAGLPFYGIEPAILDAETGEPSDSGVLTISKPWPGLARTMLGDHQRFMQTYFDVYEGHYFTGDGATRDSDGFIHISGRVDDVINRAGHRLGTAEIESSLVAHAVCAEAAVVAIPDDLKGSRIIAFVVLRDDWDADVPASDRGSGEGSRLQAIGEQLRLHVRQDISPIAAPDHVYVALGLPKTRSGKITRRLLRKLAEGCQDIAELGDLSTVADVDILPQLMELLQKYPIVKD